MGANLSKVLRRQAISEQYILDEAIYILNARIFKMNIEKNLYAPDMASPVHRKKMNNLDISHYHHLSEDRIHLSPDLHEKWVKRCCRLQENTSKLMT